MLLKILMRFIKQKNLKKLKNVSLLKFNLKSEGKKFFFFIRKIEKTSQKILVFLNLTAFKNNLEEIKFSWTKFVFKVVNKTDKFHINNLICFNKLKNFPNDSFFSHQKLF